MGHDIDMMFQRRYNSDARACLKGRYFAHKGIGKGSCMKDHREEEATKTEEGRRLRAAAYCRVSTRSDLQDGSFEIQMEYYRKYIESREEMQLVGLYGDHGKSGRSMTKREELNRLLNDCREGKIDLVLTKSVSRFARNLSECISTVRMLKEQGVSIFFEREGLYTGDAGSELLLSILAAIAQEESNSIGQNLKWARRKRYEAGQPWEPASYGYRSVGSGHRWVTEESEAKRVRTAFYLAGSGANYAEILAELNRLEELEGTGKVWKHTPLVNLLTNYAYIGDYLSNKEISVSTADGVKRRKNRGEQDQIYIEGHQEPLVSRELFEGVGEMLKRHMLFVRKTRYTKDELALMEYCRKLAREEIKKYA